MEENIFYEDEEVDENIIPIEKESKDNDNNSNNNTERKDEFISSLPSWDLVPPYEEIRRVINWLLIMKWLIF